MNWKKWDDDTWFNVNNLVLLEIRAIYESSRSNPDGRIRAYFAEATFGLKTYVKEFLTRQEAVAFVEELIK